MEIELAKCRAILQLAGARVDEYLAQDQSAEQALAAAHELMKDYQCAKWVVNQGAIDIVSHAMDLVGGAGFDNAHPLARLYRDVRAGPFMQPYSRPEARGYVGKVALGLLPDA
jgi:alkylation response protein AidB-like acyl-CoA dehydrogenase